MVGVRSHKKLTCLSGPAPTVEPGTISTVRPERHGKEVSTHHTILRACLEGALKSEFRTPKSHPEKHQLGLGWGTHPCLEVKKNKCENLSFLM
jgi:hypothetical protein